jgi:hypothetical protein
VHSTVGLVVCIEFGSVRDTSGESLPVFPSGMEIFVSRCDNTTNEKSFDKSNTNTTRKQEYNQKNLATDRVLELKEA